VNFRNAEQIRVPKLFNETATQDENETPSSLSDFHRNENGGIGVN
jgi:hypothetical protein